MESSNDDHQMVTRSKRKKLDLELDEDNELYDEIDEHGNISGLIDYSCEEDFDNELFQKELNRLRGGKIKTPSPSKKKIKKKKKNDMKAQQLKDIFMSYLVMNLLSGNKKTPTPRRGKKKKPSMVSDYLNDLEKEESLVIHIEDKEESEQEEDEYNSEEDLDYSEESLSQEETDDLELSESDESEYSDVDYDDYDEQFIELIENDVDENKEIDYFQGLDEEQKKKHIHNLEEIKNINLSNIPMRFKVLDSEMDIKTKSIAIENIDKLSEMDVSTGEYCKMDKWINGLIKIPFGKNIELPINNENTVVEKRNHLIETQKILDKAIYGHKDAKIHILQVIGKWIRNPQSGGNVLALQGPMGNGKTTLVKEGIAKAIQRPFALIALGGASDSSFFDGHSYTYEGSHWGRIIDILIESKCMNPIIYFDELDKVSETHKGEEIIHLLTHLTDPSQNNLFQDNYFPGVHIDLSKALFIFSFNDETSIDRILKDRMYVIHTKGFKSEDKISICREYILPELLETFMFTDDDIIFPDESITEIIEKHTMKEEGVRNLKRCLETIISKINIYYLSHHSEEKDNLSLTFTIKDFQLPITITSEIVNELIQQEKDIDRPPENMYM